MLGVSMKNRKTEPTNQNQPERKWSVGEEKGLNQYRFGKIRLKAGFHSFTVKICLNIY